MSRYTSIVFAALLACSVCFAGEWGDYGDTGWNDGQPVEGSGPVYRGNTVTNIYSPDYADSIYNPMGQYGSPISPDSINNPLNQAQEILSDPYGNSGYDLYEMD